MSQLREARETPEMEKLIRDCWNKDPAARPSFTEIVRTVEDMQQSAYQERGERLSVSGDSERDREQQRETSATKYFPFWACPFISAESRCGACCRTFSIASQSSRRVRTDQRPRTGTRTCRGSRTALVDLLMWRPAPAQRAPAPACPPAARRTAARTTHMLR